MLTRFNKHLGGMNYSIKGLSYIILKAGESLIPRLMNTCLNCIYPNKKPIDKAMTVARYPMIKGIA